MSIAFEPRDFLNNGTYPTLDHDQPSDVERFGEPEVDLAAVAAGTYASTTSTFDAEPRLETRIDLPAPSPAKEDSPVPPASQRLKPIAKPDREVTKNMEGKYLCSHTGCTEEVKVFNRKCEWSKHMDKHDRPYKCTAEGCEKLPGFTYSGGLLRHEREVHGKHGGPKNPLHCPHLNCKRHTGKGFSRQENLNEHLRRVHTGNGAPSVGEDTDDGVSEVAVAASSNLKRPHSGDDDGELREEIKRVRRENEELRRQVENQTRQTVAMMNQIAQLQEALGPRLAPTAQMI